MTPDRKVVDLEALAAQLGSLGVARGGVLLMHTSFSAVGPVNEGPAGLIRAVSTVLGPAGTLVMPSWPEKATQPFDPRSTPASADLGIVAQLFWSMPGVQRSEHVQAFAAAGPMADHVLQDPLPTPPHIAASPVGRVFELDGQVLLLGVNHDADTIIHLAETIAQVPYGHFNACVDHIDGRWQRIEYLENDHCCARFRLVDQWLDTAGLQSKATVGHAAARLARSRDIVEVVTSRLQDDPLVFLHQPSAACSECDEARSNMAR